MQTFKALAIVMVGIFVFMLVVGTVSRTPASDAIGAAKDAVREGLKDGGSAEFRRIGVYKDANGKISVCGEVNSHNSFGAMAGYSRFFYAHGGSAIVEDVTSGPVMDGLWKLCPGGRRL